MARTVSRARPGTAPEQRSGPRVAITLPLTLDLERGPSVPCGSLDLGTGGVCVSTAAPFALSALHAVHLGLPDGALTLRAHGVWQREAKVDGVVMTGVQFDGPGDGEKEILGSLVQRRIRELTRFLMESSTLGPLGFDDAMELTRRTRRRHFAPGRLIYERGAGRNGEISIFIVASGRVSLELPRPGRAPLVAHALACGDVFGGLPMVAGVVHCDSAVALEPCQLIEIDEYAYQELFRDSPTIARALEHAVVRRVCADLAAALAERPA